MPGFRMPTHVHIAAGARHELPEVLRSRRVSKVLLVQDPGLSNCAWASEVEESLRAASIAVELTTEVSANPRVDDARRAALRARDTDCAAVVALGGGSAMDCAKAAAMLARNDPERVLETVGRDRYEHRPLPLVAIPTTCGTGSEVTWVSVLSDEGAGRKVSIKGEAMFPVQALVDPEVLRSLPAPLIASTAMDALTHALEATTGSVANPVSDALAAEAIALIFRFLPRAFEDVAGDAEAREAVMRASTLAGLAFGNADVAAVHCLSESLGGLFDVPHGLANAILLEPVLRSHRPFVDRRLAELLPRIDPAAATGATADDATTFLQRLGALADAVSIPAFPSLEIPPADYDRIAQESEHNGSNASNPRPMLAADYRRILDELGG